MRLSRLSGIRPRPVITVSDYNSVLSDQDTNGLIPTFTPPKTTHQLSDIENYTLNQKKEHIIEYDPEIDLAEARFQQAHAQYDKVPQQSAQPLITPGVSKVNLLNVASNSRLTQQLTHRDQYLTFSSIDCILMYYLLLSPLEKGRYRLYYQVSDVNLSKKTTHGTLIISKQKSVIKELDLTYHMKSQKLTISNNSIQSGQLDYDIVPKNYSVELIQGIYNTEQLIIDPIWDPSSEHCKQQDIQIGNYICSAKEIAPSRWSGEFKSGPHSQSFKMKVSVSNVNRKQFTCKKRLLIGNNKLSFTSNFFNDSLTDPYHGYGAFVFS